MTTTEQDYIKADPVVRISSVGEWAPFDFAQDGKPVGYSNDYVRLLVSKIPGMELRFSLATSWDDRLSEVKRGETDIIHNIVQSPERENYILFTQPFMSLPGAIITQKSRVEISSLASLEGKSLALFTSDAINLAIEQKFPSISVSYYDTIAAAFADISNGKVDAVYANEPLLRYMQIKHGLRHLEIKSVADYPTEQHRPARIGVSIEKPVLFGLINKAMEYITEKELEDLQRKWFGAVLHTRVMSSHAKKTNQSLPSIQLWLVTGAATALLLFLASVLRIRKRLNDSQN